MRCSTNKKRRLLTNGYKVDLLAINSPGINGRVLRFNVGGELGSVMTAVRLSKQTKVAALVVGERLIEVLKEGPNIFRSADGGGRTISSITETGTDGLRRHKIRIFTWSGPDWRASVETYLIDVEHVGICVPRVLVQAWLVTSVNKVAGTMFLEEADHGGAAWAAVQPEDQGSRRGGASGGEEPVPHVHVSSCLHVSLNSQSGRA